MFKAISYHFVFSDDTQYSDLAPVFPDILKVILAENDHFQTPEDEENRELFITLNMNDLKVNRKPEGYNRKGKYRLIFPMDSMEFYIRAIITNSRSTNDIKRIGEKVSEMLSTAHVKFETSEREDDAFIE